MTAFGLHKDFSFLIFNFNYFLKSEIYYNDIFALFMQLQIHLNTVICLELDSFGFFLQ